MSNPQDQSPQAQFHGSLSNTQTCQVCGTQLLQGHTILERLCSDCSVKQQASKSYAQSVMPERQPLKVKGVSDFDHPLKRRTINKEGREMTTEELKEMVYGGQGKRRAGVKDDGGKLMWNLLPWKAMEGLVKVLTFGAKKYSPNGWRSVPNAKERYLAALLRHLYALNVGEVTDPESGLRHIHHVLCNAAFLAELED